MSRFIRLVFCFAGLLAFTSSSAQTTTSPYSTFGIGEFYGSALANTQGMAGVGVAHPQGWYVNNQNPALLVYNQMTVFQAGIVAEQRTISADTATEKTKGGNLNYLVMGFPVMRNRWSTSISLSPYTSVRYNLSYVEQIQNSTAEAEITEKGTGGITQLAWSNGVRLSEDFSVGLKAAYLFSSINNSYSNRLIGSQQPRNYYSVVSERTYVNDFTFSAGISYSKDSLFSRNKYRLSFGATYDFATNLRARHRSTSYHSDAVGSQFDLDTLFTRRGSISLPPGGTFGIALNRGNWTIATDISYYDWSKFESISTDDEGLGEATRMAVGGEITPEGLSDNFFKRITYRAGFSYETFPYRDPATGNKVNDLGINVGLSIPSGRSSLDLGFRYGKRGNGSTYFEEDYFRVYFGITLNDQWFIRRRFD